MTVTLKIKKLTDKAIVPTYGTQFSAGADLCNAEEAPVVVEPGETRLVHTGLASKRGLAPANKVGVIDSDYRGEVMVSLFNQSSLTQTIEYGDRIAQIAIVPFIKAQFELADELSDTVRGEGGFGSTGTK